MSSPIPPPMPSTSSPTSPPPTTSPPPSTSPDPSSSKKSNYYFFKSTPAHEAHKYLPTLLTGPPSPSPPPPSHPSPTPSPEPQGSRWNAAGTWEEKDLSTWAHTRLTSLLSSPSLPAPPGVKLTVTKVTGDATLVFTRGKKRVGYDVAVVIDWVGGEGGEVKGVVDLPSIDQTSEGDFEVTVTVKERGKMAEDAVDGLVRGLRKIKEQIGQKIQQFENELKEQ